jgi:inorganic pyrophosphatase
LTYPFDWGFVPSTQAPDGDPLDVLILHDAVTYPGVVLPCQPLGVIEMDQDDEGDKRERNDRIIVIPSWHDRLGGNLNALLICQNVCARKNLFKHHIFYSENPKILGWKGPKRASAIIKKTTNAYLLKVGFSA